ncbi:PREDICTED: TRPM8 channel-associated factor 3-like [Chinchilla lanigera]|uniref:TRPM8 channel-associated factor 3-like n=1 Tax=Chinchilla lanigera TaxID=34839 RepID=A0A8C2UP50_CHILA|nr:PREDICTED: TRPM8 channel-associated factor 3-like [Chinchilla lanigera]
MATTPSDAFQALMKGVTNWDLPESFIPSELLLIGKASFPVMVNDKGQVLIAASSYGQGRLVVVSHERYLLHAGLAPFLVNAVGWLRLSPEAPIGVHPSLEPLVNILKDAGVEAQTVPEPGEPRGAYCMDAYNDSLTAKLIQFVKHGGGLLIGGQAWYWASKHGCDKVLSSFPGNLVTSVAGVYFTDVCGCIAHFEVSTKVPNIPFHVRCGEDLSQDQQQILEGFTTLDNTGCGIPSRILVHGELAFPLAIDNSSSCFLAAARYGCGRVVLTGHESLIHTPKMGPFILNALRWLLGKKKGKIGLQSMFKGLGPMLSNSKLEWRVTQHLTSVLSVFCCYELNSKNAKQVEEFVAEGGGLLIGSQAWWWSYMHPERNCVRQYPSNECLRSFGLTILDETANQGHFPAPKPGVTIYHFHRALSQFETMLYEKGKNLEKSWVDDLMRDCFVMFQIPHKDIPIFESVKNRVIEMIKRKGLPVANRRKRIKKGSPEAVLISMAGSLVKSGTDSSLVLCDPPFLPPTELPVTIEINEGHCNSQVSTGLYLCAGQTAEVTLPEKALAAKLKILIGCHTDNLSHHADYWRPPVVTHQYLLDQAQKRISWLWGGLLYILVPSSYKLGTVPVTISGAVAAPYFKLGKTSQEEWKKLIDKNEVPWGELATDNIILTASTPDLLKLEDPASLLHLWDDIMQAVARLAAKPFPFCRPERIVFDCQISAGILHSGYPIMSIMEEAPNILNEKKLRSRGTWGALHELGHNQQAGGWNFPHHTTEATCNLWSVYVNEMVLGIHRSHTHSALSPDGRKQRIKHYLDQGAPLKSWEGWTALETYLQLQEGFGWEPFIQLFAEYQKLSGIPRNNGGKMNLWVKKFSETVKKNLAPFFKAWGWPVTKEVSDSLACLPEWEENPMKKYKSDPVKLCASDPTQLYVCDEEMCKIIEERFLEKDQSLDSTE